LYCDTCLPRWSAEWDRCRTCGETDRPHSSRGLCALCRQRERKPARQWEGGAKNRKFHVDDYIFEKWTEKSAYLFGVIASDGHVGTGKYENRVQIAISKKDEDWLSLLAKLFGFNGNVGGYTLTDEYGSREIVRFTFASPSMADRLRASGVKEPRAADAVPDAVFGHFVRGYFDGDGSVFTDSQSKKLKTNFVGSSGLITKLRDRLGKLAGVSAAMQVHPKTNSPHAFSVTYAFRDTCRLANFMYLEAEFCLQRKRLRFQAGGALSHT